MTEATQQPMQLAQPQPQCCSGCTWCEKNKEVRFTTHGGFFSYTAKQACFALKRFIEAIISSPNGVAEEKVWDGALSKGLPKWFLISKAIVYRKLHENSLQMQRRKLFLLQQQQSSPLGGVLFSAFPIMVLKHIASYLAKPSQALFAVSLGNFDMSSIFATSAATNRKSGHKRNSDGSLRKESIVCLADIPAESLGHVVSFLSGCSQALFGLSVAASNDDLLNKNSFAIVGDQWDDLDFGEIEKELAARLTDDDINAVLWCIDAANKVKRLSLAHCINITGAGLEPLRGSTIIEQIDLSLAGRHDDPFLHEIWHPPRKMDSVVVPFDPPLSCAIVLPILDSIIGGEQCSLQHLQFPKAWRTINPRVIVPKKLSRFYDPRFKPDLAFVHFLSRYNQVLTNRDRISCVSCSRDLPSSGYEMVGSSVIADDWKSFLSFGHQNHTCSQCMKHYCYRCDGSGAFLLECCNVCERDICVECSGMYQCERCRKYYCMDCKESKACHNQYCEDRVPV